MRMTREELKEKYFPSWNEARQDIVAVNYGDEPLIKYRQRQYEEYQKLTGTLANIMAVDAFIYSQNGNYDKYKTLVGDVYVSEDERVLSGDIIVEYRGKRYNITLNRMYGLNTLDVLRIGVKNVVGFSNKEGLGSPSIFTKEMDKDLIERILNDKMEDYGVGVQKFMEAARELYREDTTNYIMEKQFRL